MAEEKTQVQDIDHSLYDFRYEEKDEDFYKVRRIHRPPHQRRKKRPRVDA